MSCHFHFLSFFSSLFLHACVTSQYYITYRRGLLFSFVVGGKNNGVGVFEFSGRAGVRRETVFGGGSFGVFLGCFDVFFLLIFFMYES
ncbi:hypothetical protein BZA05DRAFT_61501 [Tricharina praecox]|uniref:uncharacterized protein n=1 Tax=Tricharina praecox TaxID=43433 RepID=UPI00221E5F13|nr:uncharacterized protein BZA05DRAFT_61501 [Tricharina praecox]KAI5850710.1 hypothetical protein BZA05DRAFT_61501 [Tricharina praecox]